MAPLPKSRVSPSRPFSVTGVDFCGPVIIRPSKNSKARTKGYIALFVCFSTKAIHCELMSDLSTPTFIEALCRFVSRRGICKDLHSDNAKTFKGCDKALKRMFSMLPEDSKFQEFLAKHRISWHYIPPRSPTFAGLWEAAIKSCKFHLRRVFSSAVFTYAEFETVLLQVEACLNSRPLTALSNDPQDLEPLTPGHFLIGEPLTLLPLSVALKPDIDERCTLKSKFLLQQERLCNFWNRWQREYLAQLHQRAKWKCPEENLTPGTLVAIQEPRLLPSQWSIGRVETTHAGADGKVRVATIRTSKGLITRGVSRLARIP
nr:PREDICTED: uncharacterized protein LOC109039408 [Bemisia tabaci]